MDIRQRLENITEIVRLSEVILNVQLCHKLEDKLSQQGMQILSDNQQDILMMNMILDNFTINQAWRFQIGGAESEREIIIICCGSCIQ